MNHIISILKFLSKNLFTIVFVIIALYRLFFPKDISKPLLVFLNVGQGDATLIQQDHFQILVDTGPDDSLLYELPKYMPENDFTIEVVILTHSHDDHIQGIFSLLNTYKVEKIIYQSQCFVSKDFEYVKANYSRELYDLVSLTTLQYGNITVNAIYPFNSQCFNDLNQDSIVLNATIKETNVLLMGDAGYDAENILLKTNTLQQVDILKAGHHCSRSATSEMFLTTIYPTIAICSCGEENKFGHPHSETIEKFEKQNVQYLITYQTGNIVFKFNN